MKNSLLYMIFAFQLVIGSVLVDAEAMRTQSIVPSRAGKVIRFEDVLNHTFKTRCPLDQSFPKVLEFSEDNRYVLVMTEKPLVKVGQEIIPSYLFPFIGATADIMHHIPEPEYAFSIWFSPCNDRNYVAKWHFPFNGTWAVDAEFSDNGKIVTVTFTDDSSMSINIDTLIRGIDNVVDVEASYNNGSCYLHKTL